MMIIIIIMEERKNLAKLPDNTAGHSWKQYDVLQIRTFPPTKDSANPREIDNSP